MNRGGGHRMNSASGMKNLLKQVRGGDVDSLRPNECGGWMGCRMNSGEDHRMNRGEDHRMNSGEDHRMNSASGMKNLLKQVRGGDVDSLRPNECGAWMDCRMNSGEDHRMNSASGMKNLLKQVRGGDVDSLRPNECGVWMDCRMNSGRVLGG